MIFPLIRLLLWFPVWLAGLICLLLGLALSPWGTAWLVSQGEQKGFLSVESVSGSPLDAMTLEELELSAGPATVRIGRLHLAWAEDCLLDGKLCLDALQLANVEVRIQDSEPQGGSPPEEKPGGGGLSSFVMPFPIELRALELRDVSVRLADGTHLSLQRFTTGARVTGDTLTLLPTRLTGGALHLPVSQGQRLAMPEASGHLTAETIDGAIMASSAEVSGDGMAIDDGKLPQAELAEEAAPLTERERLQLPEITLPMTIRIPSLVVDDFRIEGPTRHVIDRLAISLTGEGHDIRLHSLALASPGLDVELAGRVSLQSAYPLHVELNAVIHRQPLTGEELSLTLEGSLADLTARIETDGPITAQLQAQADILAPTMPFEILLQADRLEWPLAPQQQASGSEAAQTSTDSYVARNLTLRAEGDLQSYRTALSAAVSGTALPEEMNLAMTGEGNLERFAWTPLAVSADSGALISRGEVRWSPRLDVRAAVHLDRFSLDALTNAVNGRLSGDAQVRFAMLEEGSWRVSVPRLDIGGTLQDRPLSLEARLSGNSDMRWSIEQLRLRQGENTLTAQGRIADTMDLNGELSAPALHTLMPELAGSAQGNFSVVGTLEVPQVDLRLTGTDLRYAENTVNRLRLTADVAGLEDPRFDVALNVTGASAGGQRIESLDLDLEGRLSRHRLDLAVDAAQDMPLSAASLTLTGGLNADRNRYRGQLASLAIDIEQADLHLAEAVDFTITLPAGQVEAEPFCLERRQGGSLCSIDRLLASAERGHAVLALREFPIDLISAALPEAWSAEGQTNGQIEADWSAGGRWSAQASLRSHLSLSGEDAYGQPWSLPASTLSVELEATPASANLQSSLTLAESGQIETSLQIADPTGAARLSGRIRIDDIQLSPYRTLTTGVQELEGSLNGDVQLGGSLTDPLLNGNILLRDLQVRGADSPVAVEDGRLSIALQGDNASLEGFVAAEKGRLDLQGEARWPAPGEWAANLSIVGIESPLLVEMPQFGRLRVAPDLDIHATPELLRIRGQVRVPWARLTVAQSPPSAVAPSSDEVIITREDDARAREAARRAAEEAVEGTSEATAQALEEAGMRLDVAVEVILGPDVQLAAYGLETELEGNLQVRQGNGPVQLFGEVNLVDGRYQAFGQDLIIRRGEVLFSGPASQPRLQFEAIRNPEATEDGVIAGLRVTGPAEQPSLTIFSEPAMDESRALSYLLRGRAPDDAAGDGALTSALIGLSLSRTGGLVGQLGQAFGVEDLSLETSGSGEESQVVVSGYLFDDLRVSYGVGIFSPIAQLTLRYKLLQNLYLEAVSGAAQAVDLIYTFSLGRSNASP